MGDRLTALDATFLELEESDPSVHMHIGAIMVFDPLPGGDRRRSSTLDARRAAARRASPLPRPPVGHPNGRRPLAGLGPMTISPCDRHSAARSSIRRATP